jgi:hypothetical protein
MPQTPIAPVVNLAQSIYAAGAPSQSAYLGKRVNAFRSAPTLVEGAMAVVATLGSRLTPGSVATQIYPTGIQIR